MDYYIWFIGFKSTVKARVCNPCVCIDCYWLFNCIIWLTIRHNGFRNNNIDTPIRFQGKTKSFKVSKSLYSYVTQARKSKEQRQPTQKNNASRERRRKFARPAQQTHTLPYSSKKNSRPKNSKYTHDRYAFSAVDTTICRASVLGQTTAGWCGYNGAGQSERITLFPRGGGGESLEARGDWKTFKDAHTYIYEDGCFEREKVCIHTDYMPGGVLDFVAFIAGCLSVANKGWMCWDQKVSFGWVH